MDSLDTIEALVQQGIGVSVVPQRLLECPLAERLTCLPFGGAAQARRLALVERVNHGTKELEGKVRQLFTALK